MGTNNLIHARMGPNNLIHARLSVPTLGLVMGVSALTNFRCALLANPE